MATEQLPVDTYAIGGQPTVAGYEVISATPSFVEESEDTSSPAGQHKAKTTYSRRRTLVLELEALTAGTPSIYIKGGALDVNFVPTLVGMEMVWKVRDASENRTRGVQGLTLDLISLTDLLA